MINTRCFPVVMAGLVLVACGPPDFERSFEVTKLRTLAIGAEPAELGPGEVAVFSSLTVDPNSTTPASLTWEVCLLTDSPDEEYRCAVVDGEDAGFELGTGSTATLPYDALDALGLDVVALCELFGSDEIPDFVNVPDCDRGVPVTIRLTATSAGVREIAIREYLLLRPEEALRSDRNRNPFMGGLAADGLSLSLIEASDRLDAPVPDGEGSAEGSSAEPEGSSVGPPTTALPIVSQSREAGFVELRLDVDLEAEAQTWEPVDPDDETRRLEATREILRASWFTTHGEFEYSATYFAEGITDTEELGSNELDLSAGNPASSGELVRVWVVLRDDRGGVSWREWQFEFGGEI